MTKVEYERIDEGVLRCFGHFEKVERDMIAKRVYVGECAGSRSVGRPRKRWIYAVKDCLGKRGLLCQASKKNGGGLSWGMHGALPGV